MNRQQARNERWGNFWDGSLQKVVGAGIDYQIADAAMDNHMGVPENNMFTANPAMTPQNQNRSHTAGGLPFRFTRDDGSTNYQAVALAGLAVIVVLKLVKR